MMGLQLGADAVDALYLGDSPVDAVYLGSELVWPVEWFTPLDLGPALWLDASQITGLADTDPISTWPDLSGNSRHATQTGTKRPLYRTGVVNGLPVARFDGSNDCIRTPSFALGAFTIAVVFRSSGTAGLVYEHGANAGSGDGHYLYGTINNTIQVRRGSLVSSRNVTTGWATDNTWRVAIHTFGGQFNSHTLRLNGVFSGTSGTTQNPGTGTTDQVLNIGSRNDGASLRLNGDIAELVVIPNLIGVEDTVELEGYLAAKWAITLTPSVYRGLTALDLPQFEGHSNATHPDVIDFGSRWNGHRYWMAMTPFPPEEDENPTILASSHPEDGWTEPAGITNPIVATPSGGYNADNDIVYDSTTGKLYCFWGEFIDPIKKIMCSSSTDGVTWSTPVTLFSMNWTSTNTITPAVVKDGSTWRMWTVDEAPNPRTMQVRTASDPLGTWSSPTACTFDAVSGMQIWHIDVVKDADGVFRGIFDFSLGGFSRGDAIHLASSADGLDWSVNSSATFAARSGLFDGTHMYRSGGQLDGDVMRVWIGAAETSSGAQWRIGYARVPLSTWPAP